MTAIRYFGEESVSIDVVVITDMVDVVSGMAVSESCARLHAGRIKQEIVCGTFDVDKTLRRYLDIQRVEIYEKLSDGSKRITLQASLPDAMRGMMKENYRKSILGMANRLMSAPVGEPIAAESLLTEKA